MKTDKKAAKPLPPEFAMPAGLGAKGKKAWKIITDYLLANDMVDSGGHSKVFYTPAEWKERGESYGTESFLVIVHDGGAHAPAFSWDYECYKILEGLNAKLGEAGLFNEQCTAWYTAVYD